MWQIPKYLRIRLLMEEREDGDWERLDYMIHALTDPGNGVM